MSKPSTNRNQPRPVLAHAPALVPRIQDGDYRLPWVYLHALKDYADMAAHLEAHPKMRCVVNFTPVLLEQIDDYAVQFRRHLKNGQRFAEPLLNLSAGVDAIPPMQRREPRSCAPAGVHMRRR